MELSGQALSALIASAKPAARTVEICLRGDLVAEIEEATRQLALAREHKDDKKVDRLASHIAALKMEMADAVVTVRMEAMPRADWLKLLAGHPPERREPDETLGFNPETMYPAMIRAAWAAPELDQQDMERLIDSLNDGQFSELAEAAFAVNTRGAVVPFGWRGYSPAQSSEQK